MDEKDLHMLEILAEEKNITQTARRLFFSQPTLSNKIKQLEKELDCNLMVRTPKGITFTVQGEMLIHYAHHALTDLATLRQQINNASKELCGTLTIGCSFLISKYILPSLLKNFLKAYPHVNVQLQTAMSQDIFDLVQHHQVQIGILRGEYTWSTERKLLIQEDPICIVSTHPLDMSDLPHIPQIHRPLDRPLQTAIDQWWQSQYKEPPYIHLEVNTQDSCLQMTSEGLGYTILSELVSKDYPNLWRHHLQFPDGHLLIRRTHAYLPKDVSQNHLTDTFFRFLTEQIKN